MRMTLSQREITALDGALRMAREIYMCNAGVAAQEKQPRLEERFKAQSAVCSELIERLELEQ